MGSNHSTTGYSRFHSPDSLKKPLLSHANKEDRLDSALEKEVADLNLRVANMESLLRKKEKGTEAIKQKNAALEKKVLELAATIDEIIKRSAAESFMKNSNLIPDLIDMDHVSMVAASELDIQNPITEISSKQDFPEMNNPVNDLVGCLIVLIFLLAVLIGVLL